MPSDGVFADISGPSDDLKNDARVIDGLEYGHWPVCFECGNVLVDGDTLDCFWPHHSEHNLCKGCKEKSDGA